MTNHKDESNAKEEGQNLRPESKAPAARSRPEDLVFDTCYAPVDLADLLRTSDGRSRIRRLPMAHLYYGMARLDDLEIGLLLPHITQEQWTGVLDFDLWTKDRLSPGQFLFRQCEMLDAPDAVARKLLRAVDNSVWEAVLGYLTTIREITTDDPPDPPRKRDHLVTPDQHYLILLPRNPDIALAVRALLLRFYQLDAERASMVLAETRVRTTVETAEEAYQERRRRTESQGFQDYFDALSIYTPLRTGDKLPEKDWGEPREVSTLPTRLSRNESFDDLFFRALERVTSPQEGLFLLEELSFVCNKVLSADGASPADGDDVKRGIRKAVATINLGLDLWSEGSVEHASEGLRRHYVQSFFHIGYGELTRLQSQARLLEGLPAPGTIEEAAVEAMLRRFPVRIVLTRKGTLRRRFIRNRAGVEKVGRVLARIAEAARGQ